VDPDLPLIQALQSGDDSAMSELMHRHGEPLFHFVFRIVRNEAAARDVVQEAFVRAYFGAAKFTPRALVKTWLYSIALNLSRDHARRAIKQRQAVSLEGNPSGERFAEIADAGPLANDEAGKRDEFTLLQRAIDQLPRKLREALVMFSLEGKSQRESAEFLGTTPKTVELRVYHAKKKLRELLAKQGSAADLLRDQPASERLSPKFPHP
jgi:RNA polymerase sigma factor (sigma-70 family)